MISVRPGTVLAYLTAYSVAVVLGRMAVLPGTGLALFWPAAGVAALWVLRGTTGRQVLLDAVLLVAANTVVNVTVGVTPAAGVLFGLANLAQGLVVRSAVARAEDRPFTGSLPRRLSSVRDLIHLGVATLVAVSLGSAIGTTAAFVDTGNWAWTTVASWVVRNACGIFVVVAAAMAVMTMLADRVRRTHGPGTILAAEPRPHLVAEFAIATLVSVGTSLLIFGAQSPPPVSYVVIAVSAWIGFRFSPVVGGVHTTVLGTLAVLCTLAGLGPFGEVPELSTRALVVQAFVLVNTVIVLMLSLGVAERVALDEAVRRSREQATARAEMLDAVTSVMVDGLAVVDADLDFVLGNPAARALAGTGLTRDLAADPSAYGIFSADREPMRWEEMPHIRALAGERVPPVDLLRIDPETGLETRLAVSAVPLQHGEDGRPMAVLLVHDVTADRARIRTLQGFAGVTAHDLQDPLAGIVSWAEILRDQLEELSGDTAPALTSLRHISGSAERMQALIRDLLAFSTAQSAELQLAPVSLDDAVDRIGRRLREAEPDRHVVIERGPLGTVRADSLLLDQVLGNLLGNAVKYVAPGVAPHVSVSARRVESDGVAMVELTISDNGVGIPREDRGRVFDSFYRSQRTGPYPGTGLGLAICASAVERHGGSLSAHEGLDGTGTRMVLTLPEARPLDEAPANQAPVDEAPVDETRPSRSLPAADHQGGPPPPPVGDPRRLSAGRPG